MTTPSLTSHPRGPGRQSRIRWEEMKSIIHHLYLDEDLPLVKVQEILKAEHDFDATQRTFKDKLKVWGFDKNISSRDMEFMVRKLQDRKAEGKEKTTFFMHGREVDPAKIERWSKRKKGLSDSELENHRKDTPEPEYIEARTPGSEGRAAPSNGEQFHTEAAQTEQHPNRLQMPPPHTLVDNSAENTYTIRQSKSSYPDTTAAELRNRQQHEILGAGGLGTSTSTPLLEAEGDVDLIMSDYVHPADDKLTIASKYRRVRVLVLYWEDDTEAILDLMVLDGIFQNSLNFRTDIWQIPNGASHLKVASKLLEFATGATKEDLLIVYYAGEGKLTEDRQLAWTSPVQDRQENHPSVKWSGVQSILEEVESDVLILLGCCASLAVGSPGGHGVTDIIAACAFQTPNTSRTFTSALISVLRQLCSQPRSFTVAILYSRILRYYQEKWYKREASLQTTPVHVSLVEDHRSSRNIIISPMKQFGAYRTDLSLLGIPSASPQRDSGYRSQIITESFVPTKRASAEMNSTDVQFESSTTKTALPSVPQGHDSVISTTWTSSKKQKGLFQCTSPGCDITFPRISDWKRHEEQVHWPRKQWVCQLCNEEPGMGKTLKSVGFSRKDKLLLHVRMKHETDINQGNIEPWSQDVESAWPRVCGFCGERFESQSERNTHVGTHFTEGRDIKDWKIPWEGPEVR